MEPRDTPHAPRISRLVSGCSPKAAGSMRMSDDSPEYSHGDHPVAGL